MMTFDDIVAHIESLPPLSNISLTIQQLYHDGAENVNVIKLIRLIESDATLMANVLKVVNAPQYGFSKQISAVSQAVTLLGTEIVYGIVIDYAMHEKLQANLSAYGMTNIQFNDMCHLQSALVLQWISLIDVRDAQFLAPLALIMELGKLIVAKEVQESAYVVKFRKGLAKVEDISEYEYEIFDTTSYYISALLFQHWNIDERFVEILKEIDFQQGKKTSQQLRYYCNIIDVVRTAVNVRSILTDRSISEVAQKVEKMKLPKESFLHIAKRVQKSYKEKKGIA